MKRPHLTSLDKDGWMIDDGEVAHAESPESFWIPPIEARQSIGIDDYAKIRFYIRTEDEEGALEDCGERMWVKVIGRIEDWYRGELANQPTATSEIKPGLEVWFQPRHVIDIEKADS